VSWTIWWGDGRPPEQTLVDAVTLDRAPARSEFSLQRPSADQTIDDESAFPDANGIVNEYFSLPFASADWMNAYTNGMAAFPTWLPSGFRLAAAAATPPDQGGIPWPSVHGGGPLVPTITISSSYRRGFDQIAISVRVDPHLAGPVTTETIDGKTVRIDTSDPFIRNGVAPAMRAYWARHTIDVRLHGGAYSGAVAHIVIDPDHWPHLWVKKGPYVATVAGDLTVAEMVRIAESLSPWQAGMRVP
jgi:hypothetical protein